MSLRIAKLRARLVLRMAEDQPRDEAGRWTDGGGPGGGIGNGGESERVDKEEFALRPIQEQISIVRSELSRIPAGLFSEARLVGSWAKQQEDHKPDRKGEGTSDIDIILIAAPIPESIRGAERFKVRDEREQAAARILDKVRASTGREVEVRISDIVGSDRTLSIWKKP